MLEDDRNLLRLLQREGSATIKSLCDRVGVTATAIRLRLQRLEAQGFVERDTDRCGPGRPTHVYRVSAEGHKQLGDNYEELALVLWSRLKEIESPDVRQAVLNQVRDAFVARYGGKSTESPGDLVGRFEKLAAELAAHGMEVEVDSTGRLPILREHHCPYYELAHQDAAICELEKEVFSEILGRDVHLSQCCLDGHNCCEFEVVPLTHS